MIEEQKAHLWDIFMADVSAARVGGVIAKTKSEARRRAESKWPGRLHVEINQESYRFLIGI